MYQETQAVCSKHCWHVNYYGALGGGYWNNQAREICCFCGRYKEDEHGPYNPNRNPWQYSGQGGTSMTPAIQQQYWSLINQTQPRESQQEYFGGSVSGSLGVNPGGIGGRASDAAAARYPGTSMA